MRKLPLLSQTGCALSIPYSHTVLGGGNEWGVANSSRYMVVFATPVLLCLFGQVEVLGQGQADGCATEMPPELPSTQVLNCSTVSIGWMRVYNDHYEPLPGDDVKTIKVRFVFLQRPGDNEFENNTYAILSLSNSAGDLEIKCNDFQNSFLSIWGLGNNRAVQFDANEFFIDPQQANQNHDIVLSSVGNEAGSFGMTQGSLSNPRLNLFSSSLAEHHVLTNTFSFGSTPPLLTEFFHYYHPTPILNPRLMPICDDDDGCAIPNYYHNQDVGNVGGDQIPECIDITDFIGGGGIVEELCQTKECLETLRTYIHDLRNNIDGGDKEQLIADLDAYPNGEATFQLLRQKSPYLSDEVLIQIAQTTGMAAWKRANLLVINSPLSDKVMEEVSGLVSEYTYQILESIRYYDQLSDRGMLEDRISEEERKKASILSHLLNDLVQQKDMEQIAELIADETPEYALRTLTSAYLKVGNIAQAQSVLDQIPIFDAEDQQFRDIHGINIERALNPQFDLSPEQESIVRQIAADTYSTQAGYARGLLWLYRDEVIPIELPDFETAITLSGKSQSRKSKPRFSADDLNSLLLFPNPAHSELVYYLPPSKQGNSLAIYDLNGEQKTSISIDPEQRIGQISVANLPNGVYIVTLLEGEKRLFSAKLLVAH